MGVRNLVLGSICLFTLAGCGLNVPEKDLFHANTINPDTKMSRQGTLESQILANIRCDVTKGLYKAFLTEKAPWLSGWGTSVSMNLQWDETVSLAPSLSYANLDAKSRGFGASTGFTASVKATRNESITLTWDNSVLLQDAADNVKNNQPLDCSRLQSSSGVRSDLKIGEFIYDKVSLSNTYVANTRPVEYPTFSVFSETITFVVSMSGGVTPSWTLKRFNINPAPPLLGGGRTKTSIIIVTLGPIEKQPVPAGPVQLAQQAQLQHDAAIIGNATASSLLNQLP